MFYTLACREVDYSLLQGGVPSCADWSYLPVQQQFSLEQLDPAVMGQLFGLGFGMVATVMVLGIGVRAVLSFIKSA